jgi:hypothetical protein
MKSLIPLTGLVLVLTLSACEEPVSRDAEMAPPVEVPIASAAEDAGVPAADATAPTDQPPLPTDGSLPPANPSSEESVQPESETLFY